jgi:hypothetical protein
MYRMFCRDLNKAAGKLLDNSCWTYVGYRLGNVHIILKTLWKYVFRSMSRDFLIGCMTIKKIREENSLLTAITEKGARHIASRASANINIYQNFLEVPQLCSCYL